MKTSALPAFRWAPALLVALAACAPTPSSPTPPAALAPRACLDLEDAPELPSLYAPVTPRILVGGTVPAGDFRIGIWLYCDPSLVGTDPFSPDFSEIAGLGLHTEWVYLGAPRQGDVETTVTANGALAWESGRVPGLNAGDGETSTGGMRSMNGAVARAAAEGQPIEFMLTVRGEGYEQAARLEVVFEATADGYVLSHASLGP